MPYYFSVHSRGRFPYFKSYHHLVLVYLEMSHCVCVSFLMGKMAILVTILTSWDCEGVIGSRRSASCQALRSAHLGQSLHPSAPILSIFPSFPLCLAIAYGTFAFRGVIAQIHLFQETRPLRILL